MPVALTAPAVIDTLASQLRNRPAITADPKTQVYTAPAAKGAPWPEQAIVIIRVTGATEHDTVGHPGTGSPTRERYTIEGVVSGRSAKAGEDGAVAARARATAMLNELHLQVLEDPSIGGLVHWALLSSYDLDQGVVDDAGTARLCVITWGLSVRARVPSGGST